MHFANCYLKYKQDFFPMGGALPLLYSNESISILSRWWKHVIINRIMRTAYSLISSNITKIQNFVKTLCRPCNGRNFLFASPSTAYHIDADSHNARTKSSLRIQQWFGYSYSIWCGKEFIEIGKTFTYIRTMVICRITKLIKKSVYQKPATCTHACLHDWELIPWDRCRFGQENIIANVHYKETIMKILCNTFMQNISADCITKLLFIFVRLLACPRMSW